MDAGTLGTAEDGTRFPALIVDRHDHIDLFVLSPNPWLEMEPQPTELGRPEHARRHTRYAGRSPGGAAEMQVGATPPSRQFCTENWFVLQEGSKQHSRR